MKPRGAAGGNAFSKEVKTESGEMMESRMRKRWGDFGSKGDLGIAENFFLSKEKSDQEHVEANMEQTRRCLYTVVSPGIPQPLQFLQRSSLDSIASPVLSFLTEKFSSNRSCKAVDLGYNPCL